MGGGNKGNEKVLRWGLVITAVGAVVVKCQRTREANLSMLKSG